MNQQDREHIEELKTILEKQSETLDSQSKAIELIRRAIYGDKENKVDGMIIIQRIMDERIHDLEEGYKEVSSFKKKFIYYGSVVIAMVGYGINKLIDFLIKTMS